MDCPIEINVERTVTFDWTVRPRPKVLKRDGAWHVEHPLGFVLFSFALWDDAIMWALRWVKFVGAH